MNLSSICVNFTRVVPPGTVLYYVGHVMPAIFAAGIIGNILNLIVLGARNRTNIFLSCMAFADLCFLFLMNWFNLTTFDSLATHNRFLSVYYGSRTTTTLLANWFSACSTWFAVAVTAERFIAVRYPLKVSYFLNRTVMALSIVCILLITLLSCLHHFFVTYLPIGVCGKPNRVTYFLYIPSKHRDPVRYEYIRVSIALSAVVCAVVPIVALTLINGWLIFSLRSSRRALANLGHSSGTAQERRVTVTVVIITLTALLLLTPSVALMLWDAVAFGPGRRLPPWYRYFGYFCNFLVILDRTSNFVLYCLSSQTFRNKLIDVMRPKCGKGQNRRKSGPSTVTHRTSCPSAVHRMSNVTRPAMVDNGRTVIPETVPMLTTTQ